MASAMSLFMRRNWKRFKCLRKRASNFDPRSPQGGIKEPIGIPREPKRGQSDLKESPLGAQGRWIEQNSTLSQAYSNWIGKNTQSQKLSSLWCFLCFFTIFVVLHTRSAQSSRIDKSIVFMMFFHGIVLHSWSEQSSRIEQSIELYCVFRVFSIWKP